jgi:hypothetical protein
MIASPTQTTNNSLRMTDFYFDPTGGRVMIAETWYLLYGGESVDGTGPGRYVGRTCSVVDAAKHFIKVSKNPYSTGYVKVITDDEVVQYWCIDRDNPATLTLRQAIMQLEES